MLIDEDGGRQEVNCWKMKKMEDEELEDEVSG